MKAVIQRVLNAEVRSGGKIAGKITRGLLVYLGVARNDTQADADWLAEKTARLRIFEDENGKMNLSVKEMLDQGGEPGGGVLAVSQFTLLGDARKGRRPSYGEAADPESARRLYEYFAARIREQGLFCETGVFQTRMAVTYTNDGPVTILLDSKKRLIG
jgi:D-tyrosyl-tRNA(Tyr) deacylase